MFTIVHKGLDGHEHVFAAKSVQCFRQKTNETDYDPGVLIELPDGGDAARVHYGFSNRPGAESPVIYVMNERGATVATYYL